MRWIAECRYPQVTPTFQSVKEKQVSRLKGKRSLNTLRAFSVIVTTKTENVQRGQNKAAKRKQQTQTSQSVE